MKHSQVSSSEVDTAFDRLHPIVQKWIWNHGWTELRDIQAAAINAILGSDRDIIIAAATAAGKTEAAFLPILSSIGTVPKTGFRALYIGPLKALINDQFLRLEDLCERLNIPVVKWHGDAPQAGKSKARADPSGVMLITPESIEAMFIRRPGEIVRFFGGLEYVVIDELHAFIEGERGVQVSSLLKRMFRRTQRIPRRIGLSATLGDLSLAAKWLNPDEPNAVRIVEVQQTGSDLKLQIRSVIDPAATGEDLVPPQTPSLRQITNHVFSTLRGQGNHLIFAGSRKRVEEVADQLREDCEASSLPNEFFPHHGSLARDARETLEARLKEGRLPTTAVATTTLELGIDIGSVQSVAQIGAPGSVAALRQRLGRSGRRAGTPSVMRIYVSEPEISASSELLDRLRMDTVQAIAAVRLLLERWVEPPSLRTLHFSTLLHQILSVIVEHGGVSPAALTEILHGPGPFAAISPPLFADLLRAMAITNPPLIEQASDGTLMLGPLGEQITARHDFYAVFSTREEFRIVAGKKTLGTLSTRNAYAPDDYIIFSGRRWRVREIEDSAMVIYVDPAPAGRAPIFEGGEGIPIHNRIAEEMRAVYRDVDVPVFLNQQAQSCLSEGRETFDRIGLHDSTVVEQDGEIHIFLWRGTRAVDTFRFALKRFGIQAVPFTVGVSIATKQRDDLRAALSRLADEPTLDPNHLAADVRTLAKERFDHLIGEKLLRMAFAADRLSPQLLPEICRGLLSSGNSPIS